jgi:hypothetical protein
MTAKKKLEEEKVILTGDVYRNKRAMINMTLKVEGLKEKL